MNSYKISSIKEKYIEILKLNPVTLKLEFFWYDFQLRSSLSIDKIKLFDGISYSPEKAFLMLPIFRKFQGNIKN